MLHLFWQKRISILPLLTITIIAFASPLSADQKTDIIWVQKAKRQLHIIKDYQITHSYPIALGKNPLGHKQREGDSRTPEGLYYIDGINENSDFYLSLHISYPSPRDHLQAVRMNTSPGKHIMIHGEPSAPNTVAAGRSATNSDWTNGCIALSNKNMQELWDIVEVGTSVLIDP